MKYGVITDDLVAPLWGEKVAKEYHASLFVFPHGEKHKTRATKEALEDRLLEQGFNKECCLIGLGGGVVTDMAGFIASTFARGVPLILIPTTLLAMVDASVGGKNGVNTPHGKNLIGTLYPPKEIKLDMVYLSTLPEREKRQGVAEMLKHGFLNSEYLQLIMSEGVTENSIRKSIEVKREWIAKNRDALNFGHTVAHALEKESDYTLPHGEAVSIGMVVESRIAKEMGQKNELEKIEETLKQFNLPTKMDSLSPENVYAHMKMDKKNLNDEIRFSFIEGPVDEGLIKRCLQQ